MKKITGYLRLMRPANIITSIADVLAGIAIAGSVAIFYDFNNRALWFLVLSTSFLYGGGVVLNDVFDADLDKIERPERPIPSGLIKKSDAAIFGTVLLILGVIAAALSQPGNVFSYSTIIAAVIAVAATSYDKWLKHHGFFGPLTMGFCRGCNLLLGMSILAGTIELYWFLALVPVVYIFAITMISRHEIHGGKRPTLYGAALLYIMVILAIFIVSFLMDTMLMALPFIAFFSLMTFIPLQKAINKPVAARIGKAVKFGVISLIIMNASWAAAFNNLYFALLIIILLPISMLLARMFAVT